ncbi:MAG: hypothetical protein EZS26_003383 [Candidatus Ordinivivax streblomastigis]|uniref:Uncharacterized protein n=1 Tax=Candidatus Ordinivivax streblomastigis TaxID=2540710 RepID=A0A5M8NUE1_9BACT|nr:MAG: hypothetical protein EZS26_003383 [Candidatus Ordinivivax streblomastigis]
MAESLFLNTLAFAFPEEAKTFYFSLTDRPDCNLTKLNHVLFPNNIREIFPTITNGDTLYTSFCKPIKDFLPLEIDFATEKFALVKRYYTREIKYYFTKKDKLVEQTFIKDNQIWLRNNSEKAPKNCVVYDRYTIKVNFNHFINTPELVLSYDRKAKVLKQSVAAFLSNNENTTADLLNRVIYIEYFDENKKNVKRSITKYSNLCERNNVDYNNVFPIVGRQLAASLRLDDEEDTNIFQKKNRYTKYYGKISRFYNDYLNKDDFRRTVPIAIDGFSFANPMQVGKTTPQNIPTTPTTFGHISKTDINTFSKVLCIIPTYLYLWLPKDLVSHFPTRKTLCRKLKQPLKTDHTTRM